MASRLATGAALMFINRPSMYKRLYKHSPKGARKAYTAAQRQATALSPSNKNFFKEALEYIPPVQRSNPQQSVGQASGLAISKQTPTRTRRKHKTPSSRRSKAAAYTR